jgi:hypothetical protein
VNLGLESFPRALQDLIYWLVPVGCGFDFWGDEADVPKGYILAYGQDIFPQKNPKLYRMWTKGGVHKYGAGSVGNATKAPDKRGRGSIAKDDMGGTAANRVTSGGSGIAGNTLGGTGGGETVSLSEAQLGPHAGHATGNGADVQTTAPGYGAFRHTGDVSRGSGTAINKMNPGIVCNYIIRAG